jgi:hypothetical protein
MGKDCFGVSAISDLPYYIRYKFQCGFPEDWKEVKLAWEKFEEQGEFLYKNTKGLLRNICVILVLSTFFLQSGV